MKSQFSYIANGEEKWYNHLVFYNIHLPCDPAILLLSIYPKEIETYIQNKTYKECSQQPYS